MHRNLPHPRPVTVLFFLCKQELKFSRFVSLLQRVATDQSKSVSVIQSRPEVKQLVSNEELKTARGLLIERLVGSNRHFETSEPIFLQGSIAWGLFIDGYLKGVVEVLIEGKVLYLDNPAISLEVEDLDRARFLKRVVQELGSKRRFSSVCIRSDLLRQSLIKLLTLRNKPQGNFAE